MPNRFLVLLNWFCLLDPNIFFQVLLPFQVCRFADCAPRGCSSALQLARAPCFPESCRAMPRAGTVPGPRTITAGGLDTETPWRGYSIVPTCRHPLHHLSTASLSHILPSPFQVPKTSRALRQHRDCSCLWPLDWRRRGIWWVFSLLAVGGQAESSR